MVMLDAVYCRDAPWSHPGSRMKALPGQRLGLAGLGQIDTKRHQGFVNRVFLGLHKVWSYLERRAGPASVTILEVHTNE